MMKKRIDLLAVICLVLMIVAFFQLVPSHLLAQTTKPSSSSTEKINLRFAIDYPEPSSLNRFLIKPILDEIEQKSNGRITITRYLGGILGKGPELYDMVKTGKVDFTSYATGYAPGRFPMCDVLSLPGAYENNVDSQEVALEVYDRILYKEFPDTHSLSFHQAQLFYVYTVAKPIRVMEDFKGLKLRTAGGFVTDALKTLGAAPVPIALGDVYTSLQTGVINGVVIGPSAFPGYKLQEVLKHCTRFKFGTTTHVFTMNPNTWEKIPGDLRKMIGEAVRKWGGYQMAMWQKDDTFVTKTLADKGGSTYTLPPAEEARWIEALKPIVNNWLAGLKAKGLPADELMNIVREETKKRNIPFPY
jgi:TRAP-type C4-dicarboxylate transport system substrate-binding protein